MLFSVSIYVFILCSPTFHNMDIYNPFSVRAKSVSMFLLVVGLFFNPTSWVPSE
jgi:hypothetical protein